MKNLKTYLYGTLLALPLLGLSYYFLNPPQCPEGYTQAEIDAAHCIVGASIGGSLFFVALIPIVWLCAVLIVRKLRR